MSKMKQPNILIVMTDQQQDSLRKSRGYPLDTMPFLDSFARDGVDLAGRYDDCGCLIFDSERQDTLAGGSGCGCSASVLCCHVLNGMREGRWRRVIFAATGALMSPVSAQQGESIPGICHAVVIETGR